MKTATSFFTFVVISLIICMSKNQAGFEIAASAESTYNGNQTDKLALLAFKKSIDEDPLGIISSWDESLHFCNWTGVSCSRRHEGRVTSLDLTGKKLVGSMPPQVGNLTFLRRIDLSSNSFKGEIPREVGRLSRLRYFNLSYNYLRGKIPTHLSFCSNLQYIDLNGNSLAGEIPLELSNLTKSLLLFGLAGNNLTGRFPSWIVNASSLVKLSLRGNKLHGSIPEELGRLSKLEFLQISQTNLAGLFPPSIFNLSLLYMLSAGYNNFHGKIPADIGFTLPSLRGLYLGPNNFYGQFPVSLANASQLEEFSFVGNNISGTVPSNLGSLKSLRSVMLYGNQLETSKDEGFSFLTSLTNCSNLEILDIGGNIFEGELPASIVNFSTTLEVFAVAQNQISGNIPEDIGKLDGVSYLVFSDNYITGEIPPSIGKLERLSFLSLDGNRISGQIPSSLGNMTQLFEVYLQENNLQGTIPPSLGNWSRLEILSMHDNNLTGSITKEVFSSSSARRFLLGQNYFTGQLPQELGHLSNVLEIDVSQNWFSGEIPSSLGKCLMLESLQLQDNVFVGSVPSTFSSLKSLKFLDLSRNNLSGQIPKYLQNFTLLQNLNLSFNNLEGEVPHEGVFTNASMVSVIGNHKLCGGTKSLGLAPCEIQGLKKRGRTFNSILIIPIAVSCSILVVAIIVFFVWRKRSRKEASTMLQMQEQFPKISYAELSQATDEFSSANLIGEGSYGSVYKGTLGEDRMQVAVKVVNLRRKGASKSFMAECEALRNIRHRNLVRIITICSSIDFKENDFKALVYDFMENGSLDEWLHPGHDGKNDVRSLNFFERLKIAIEVASAIEYLHHHCRPPIIHGDLKPSNVLLDRDMVAHVGDFGLASFLTQSPSNNPPQGQNSSIGIKGTVGYVAPEYGMGGKQSTPGDVYSFGILLLELITARRPTDTMFNDGLTLHQFAKTKLPLRVADVLEQPLLEEVQVIDETEEITQQGRKGVLMESFVAFARIGVLCSSESPGDRMEMKDAVIELCAIRHKLLGNRI